MTEGMVPSGFRIALRVEGEFWCAYFCKPGTMEDATLLGSIRMTLAAHDEVKNDFIRLMQLCMAVSLQAVGADVKDMRWGDPYPAPEHERSKG